MLQRQMRCIDLIGRTGKVRIRTADGFFGAGRYSRFGPSDPRAAGLLDVRSHCLPTGRLDRDLH